MTRSAVGSPLVEVAGLSVRTAGGPLLDHVSLTLESGTVHALVGRNGAGKTTLLRALLGEVEFTGSIRTRAATVGYVPQRLEFDRTLALTVVEFLALTRQRRPVCLGVSAAARARADGVLAAAGLDDRPAFGARPIAELSGGELRRLLLAHALDPRPELLLLDEPTDGFDRAALVRFEATIRELHTAGTAVLLISHDRDLVARLADTVTSLDPAPAEANA